MSLLSQRFSIPPPTLSLVSEGEVNAFRSFVLSVQKGYVVVASLNEYLTYSVLEFLRVWLNNHIYDFVYNNLLTTLLTQFLRRTVLNSPHKETGLALLDILQAKVVLSFA